MSSPIVGELDAQGGDIIILGPSGRFHMHWHADGTACVDIGCFEIVRAPDQAPPVRAAVAASWESFTEYGRNPNPNAPLLLDGADPAVIRAVFGKARPDPSPKPRPAPKLEPEPYLLRTVPVLLIEYVWALALAATLGGIFL